MTDSDRELNDTGVVRQLSLVSCYEMPSGVRLSVVTKADRTCTFIHIAPTHG